MTETPVIDLRDKSMPPPDDPERAPYGWRWDTRKREWAVKRSAGGRKSGSAWYGKNAPEEAPEQQPAPGGFFQGRGAASAEDPRPAWMDRPAPKAARRTVKVTKQVKDDMSAAVGMLAMFTGPYLMARDPYCGTVLMENMQKITDAVIPLLCRSSTVVSFFSDTSDNGWMLWFQLGIAITPVAVAAGRHHVLKTIEIVTDDSGELYARPRDMSAYATEAPDAVDAP